MQERLEREFNLSLIMTAPSVNYLCHTTDGRTVECSNPAQLPESGVRDRMEEPFVRLEIITPSEYNGQLMDLCQSRRGALRAADGCVVYACLHAVLGTCECCAGASNVQVQPLECASLPWHVHAMLPESGSCWCCHMQTASRTRPPRAGEFKDLRYLTTDRCTLEYVLPLAEVVTDFFNEVKGRSKGYASMEYMLLGPQESDLVRLDVKINGEFAEPLATICHRCAPA